MQLFQKMILRRFSCYKEVTRSKGFRVVKRSTMYSDSVSKLIDAKIKAVGPITVAEYMKMVLTSPLTGYYMRKDVFGRKGDFITSPDISQMFGEILAVWIYYELHKIGLPKPWQLLELGPGRGTLTKDILRVLGRLQALDGMSIHMVEISPQLASIQAQVLCEDVVSIGSVTKRKEEDESLGCYRTSRTCEGLPISWYRKIEDVPRCFSVIIAHEFFDAFPIHKYQRVADGWREVLINSRTSEVGESKYEFVLSNKQTPTVSQMLIRENEAREHLEICPEAGTVAKYIAELLEEEGGFSLFIDYGHDGTKTDTFRAFKNHELHDPLVDPGSADLTADVDFSFLREVMKKKVLVLGPVEQGQFLLRMGIRERLNALMNSVKSDEEKKLLQSGYDMIVDRSQMGERYKVMAAFPLVLQGHLEKFPVAGFSDPPKSV